MLDAVPDSVLICGHQTDQTDGTRHNEVAARGFYANVKMNNFFGRDVVNYSELVKKK